MAFEKPMRNFPLYKEWLLLSKGCLTLKPTTASWDEHLKRSFLDLENWNRSLAAWVSQSWLCNLFFLYFPPQGTKKSGELASNRFLKAIFLIPMLRAVGEAITIFRIGTRRESKFEIKEPLLQTTKESPPPLFYIVHGLNCLYFSCLQQTPQQLLLRVLSSDNIKFNQKTDPTQMT